jgi:hypothetical protein
VTQKTVKQKRNLKIKSINQLRLIFKGALGGRNNRHRIKKQIADELVIGENKNDNN